MHTLEKLGVNQENNFSKMFDIEGPIVDLIQFCKLPIFPRDMISSVGIVKWFSNKRWKFVNKHIRFYEWMMLSFADFNIRAVLNHELWYYKCLSLLGATAIIRRVAI